MREDNWGDLGDQEALRYDLIKNREVGINGQLNISLAKIGVESIKIDVRNNNATSSIEKNDSHKILQALTQTPNTNLE